jgi:hypothetical protein
MLALLYWAALYVHTSCWIIYGETCFWPDRKSAWNIYITSVQNNRSRRLQNNRSRRLQNNCFLSWKSNGKRLVMLITASEDTLEHVSCTCNIHRYIHAYTLTRTIHICQPLANYTIDWTSNKLQKAKTKKKCQKYNMKEKQPHFSPFGPLGRWKCFSGVHDPAHARFLTFFSLSIPTFSHFLFIRFLNLFLLVGFTGSDLS